MGECGFNVNLLLPEKSENMAEKIEGSKPNPAEAKPEVQVNAEATEVPIKEPSASTDALELKVNALVADMEKIKAENAKLTEDAKLRQNAQMQAENEIFAATVRAGLKTNVQIEWDAKHKAEFMANPEAWLKKNMISMFRGFEGVKVQPPVSTTFVPRTNEEEDPELKANAEAVDFLKAGVH